MQMENTQSEIVKLVIWDLDQTFWQGTLAEDEHISVPDSHIKTVKDLTDRGIINSICSKNDKMAAQSVLETHGVWEYFVFPHIAFSPKGEAVKGIIEDMSLRAQNVLFIDDNTANLEEVRYYNPDIQLLPASEAEKLLELPALVGNPDPEHKRLSQYRLLEKRRKALDEAHSNEAFLRESGIHVQITPSRPEDSGRVHEMLLRTNQLNFTKKRLSPEEVAAIIADTSKKSATVRVYDRFGDHGVIGWYCLSGEELIHFLFSCRIINLGIEQHLYAYLGHPKLETVGETASKLSGSDKMADYITIDDIPAGNEIPSPPKQSDVFSDGDKLKIYALGACDLYYMVGHMALPVTKVHFECNTFRGKTRGVNVATEYVRSCFEMNETEKDFCRAHFHNYTGSGAFDSKIFSGKYDFICLSFHDDFALELYQHQKRSNLRIVLSSSKSGSFTPILNPENIENFDGQAWLARDFIPLGLISPQRFKKNLDWIMDRLPKETRLILMTGPEYDYFRDSEPHNPAFRQQIIRLNGVIRNFCACNSRAALVEMNDVVCTRDHFTNFIMHLKPERSYMLACHMLRAMAKMPKDRNRDLRIRLPIGARRLALWGSDSFLLPNYYALCALGLPPDAVVVANARGRLNDVEVHDASMLSGHNGEYYVMALVGKDFEDMKKALDHYGFKPDKDYCALSPAQFSLDWRE
jgi:FkbH-like protein